jgi:hypothetical protein
VLKGNPAREFAVKTSTMQQKKQQLDSRLDQLGYIPKAAYIAYDNLLKSLKKEETILYLLEGSIRNSIGFMVATDQRVYYVGINKHKMPFLSHIMYDDIKSISYKESKVSPSMEIVVQTGPYGELRVIGVESEEGKEFVELINLLINKPE